MYTKFNNFYQFNLLATNNIGLQSLWFPSSPIYNGPSPEDIIDGDAGDNTLNGTANDDTISGFGGNDTLFGNDGNDMLIGGTGADIMRGGNGDDMFIINSGDDTVGDSYRGDAGNDTIVNNSGTALVLNLYDFFGSSTISGFQVETIDMGGQQINGTALVDNYRFGTVAFTGQPVGTDIATLAGNDIVEGSGVQGLSYDLGTGNDTFNGSTVADIADIVDGGDGNDTLNGDDGNDILTGGLGDDALRGENGDDMFIVGVGHNNVADTYRGDGGIDTIVNDSGINFLFSSFDAFGAVTINGFTIEFIDLNGHQMSGTSGDDFLRLGTVELQDRPGGFDVITLGGEDDVEGSRVQSLMYHLGGDDDTFDGSTVADITDIVDGGDGNDLLRGDGGNDILTGGLGDDMIFGENGDDMLIVGLGHNNVADIYRGGAGIDTLVNDTGMDFLFTYYDAAGLILSLLI